MNINRKKKTIILLSIIGYIGGLYFLNLVILYQDVSNIKLINNDSIQLNPKISATEDWYRIWGTPLDDDTLARMAIDNITGDLYIVGYTEYDTSGDVDMRLIKYNSSGNLIWNETYNSGDKELGSGVAVDQNYVYMSGTKLTGIDTDFALLQYNTSGDFEWIQTYDNDTSDMGVACDIDSLGNIYFAGASPITASANTALMKYNSTGNLEWIKYWDGGAGYNMVAGVKVDHVDNIYVAGSRNTGGWDDDAFIIKYDSAGNRLWNRTWGGNDGESVNALDIDSQNNIYLTGHTDSYGDQDDIYVLKYTSGGSMSWYKTWKGFCYRGFCGGTGNDICVGPSDIIYVACDVYYPPDGLVYATYDTSGNRLSEGGWQGAGSYGLHTFSVVVDKDDNVYLGGLLENGPVGQVDMIIVKNPKFTYPGSDDDDDDSDDEVSIPYGNSFLILTGISVVALAFIMKRKLNKI